MCDTELVVHMRFAQKPQIARVPILALPLLDLVFHAGEVCRQLELLAIAEPDVVVWLTFDQLDALSLEAGIQVCKRVVEEAREEQQRWPLVESLIA